MANFRFFNLLVLSLILGTNSSAESRDSLRQLELIKQFDIESVEDKEKKIKEQSDLRPNDTKLGIEKFSLATNKKFKVQDILGQILSPKNGYFYKLTIKAVCIDDENSFPVIPKYKSLKWNIKLAEGKQLKGDTSLNERGTASIFLRSTTEFLNEKMSLELNGQTKDFDLMQGPYEIFFPQQACSKNSKNDARKE